MVEEVDDGSTPAIISTTAAGIITGFNHAAERLLGVDATQVVGQVTPVVFHDPTELVRRMAAKSIPSRITEGHQFGMIVERVTVGHVFEEEWTYVHRDGYRFPVVLSVSAVPDRTGQVLSLIHISEPTRPY